jgi:hypothetical protein
MKRGTVITADEVRHLDHRWGVLESFKIVASERLFLEAGGGTREGRIYRGCMDGAIATCRSLAGRFGISIRSDAWKTYKPCSVTFKLKVRRLINGASDSDCEALWDVLVAANRCVCHLEEIIVDHKVTKDVLLTAINLIQAIIRGQIAKAKLPKPSWL